MTAKQILDAFSETLMQDERILSPRERELLTSLLQNSRTVSSSNPEIQNAVTVAITRSVGETVAQRAFTLLGGSIVERILARPESSGTQEAVSESVVGLGAPQPPAPQPPRGAPQPPAPQPPGHAPLRPTGPQPPSRAPQPPAPQPPGSPHGVIPSNVPVLERAQLDQPRSDHGVGVLEEPAITRVQCVLLDEFLSPQELNELMSYVLQHEAEFKSSEVISPIGDPGVIDYDHRRSRVLMDLGKHEAVMLDRVRGVLPSVLRQLGIEEFPITNVEAQITASNDGDFFRAHSDDAQAMIASRRITFVYFFHREPRQFEGGELRLYDTPGAGSYQSILPQQNQIVFFPCSVLHEITRVECPSRAFPNSRFTLNGWLHK